MTGNEAGGEGSSSFALITSRHDNKGFPQTQLSPPPFPFYFGLIACRIFVIMTSLVYLRSSHTERRAKDQGEREIQNKHSGYKSTKIAGNEIRTSLYFATFFVAPVRDYFIWKIASFLLGKKRWGGDGPRTVWTYLQLVRI